MFKFPKQDTKPRRVLSEGELGSYEQEDNYKRKKWLLNSTTIVLIVIIVAMPIILGSAMIVDGAIRTRVVDLIVTNVPGLLYAGLAMAGVRVATSKSK